MKRLKPWLLIFLVFLAGFAGGVVATRVAVRHFVLHVVRDPDFMRERIEHRISTRLRLDASQRAKVHEILLDTQGELKNLRGEFQPRFHSILNGAQSQIAAELTPEQRERFERLQRENRIWWQTRRR